MKQHIISPKASEDLSEIIDYFVRINIDAGEHFVEKFDKKCKYLANFPNMGLATEILNLICAVFLWIITLFFIEL